MGFEDEVEQSLGRPYRHERQVQADMARSNCDVRFSNRPFGVKRFQTIHDCGVDVARGLVLLSGIGT
jgi:hypothetical protein